MENKTLEEKNEITDNEENVPALTQNEEICADVIMFDDTNKKKEKKRKLGVGRIVFRCLLSFFTLILVLAAGLYSVVAVVMIGPSASARDKLVTSTLEMSAAKWVPKLFFTQAEIDQIIENNNK